MPLHPHPTHRPDRLTRNECGRGDVSRPSDLNPRSESHSACASFEPGSVSPSRATVGPQAAETSPAAWVGLTNIGACAGKIADWSIAGRIGEGQPVPRFGSVARSPLTGRGSDGRPGQFLDWCALGGVLRDATRARASRLCVLYPVPSHGANERLGQFLDTADVLRGTRAASLPVVKFVRARLAGLPGLARIAVQRVSAALAGAVLQVKQVFLSRAFHAFKIALESHPCPTSGVSDPTPHVPRP